MTKTKKRRGVAVSIFEIAILVASIIAFSYIVGQEFEVVSAADVCLEGKVGTPVKIDDRYLKSQEQINSWCKTANNANYCNKLSGAEDNYALKQIPLSECVSSATTAKPSPADIANLGSALPVILRPRERTVGPTYTATDLEKAIK